MTGRAQAQAILDLLEGTTIRRAEIQATGEGQQVVLTVAADDGEVGEVTIETHQDDLDGIADLHGVPFPELRVSGSDSVMRGLAAP